jgi:hypothetical protein
MCVSVCEQVGLALAKIALMTYGIPFPIPNLVDIATNDIVSMQHKLLDATKLHMDQLASIESSGGSALGDACISEQSMMLESDAGGGELVEGVAGQETIKLDDIAIFEPSTAKVDEVMLQEGNRAIYNAIGQVATLAYTHHYHTHYYEYEKTCYEMIIYF